MKSKRHGALVVAIFMAGATITGCKKQEEATSQKNGMQATAPSMPAQASHPSQQLVAVKFGPAFVKAGADFHVQPNGQSALWLQGENITPSTIIVLNSQRMKSDPKKDGKTITCLVPKTSYSTPGEYPVSLLDTKTGAKSNELKFVVK